MAYATTRDVFHPLVLAVPIILAFYVILPLRLFSEGSLSYYLTAEQLQYVQLISLLGIAAFCSACLLGSWGKPRRLQRAQAGLGGHVLWVALALGGIGSICYAIEIINVGGLKGAYGTSYGGGWSQYGYLRDSVHLCIPALILIMLSAAGRKLTLLERAACALFAAPYVIQGVLGARRGPSFQVAVAVALSWYWSHRKRPRLTFLYLAGLGMGVFLLFLVANRDNIYLGSNWQLEQSPLTYFKVGDNGYTANEYIYGAGTILNVSMRGDYYWGRRYLAEFFIRPIPHQIWPDKYAAVGLPQIKRNMGTGTSSFEQTLGWTGGYGAAPGMVADMWLEFWWFSLLALGLIGWLYGRSWRAARWRGGFYEVIYVVEACLVLFLIFQAPEPMLFRFVEMIIPTWALWRLARVPVPVPLRNPQVPVGRRLGVRPSSPRMLWDQRSAGSKLARKGGPQQV